MSFLEYRNKRFDLFSRRIILSISMDDINATNKSVVKTFETASPIHKTFSCHVGAGTTVLCLNSQGNRLIAAGKPSRKNQSVRTDINHIMLSSTN
jgi:hypothetical protein